MIRIRIAQVWLVGLIVALSSAVGRANMTGSGTTPSPPATTPGRSAEQRLKELGVTLPPAPEPFGTYAEAVQTGNLLFLTGMLPTEGRRATIIVAVSRFGNKYLKTEADGEQPDNLLSLPECP